MNKKDLPVVLTKDTCARRSYRIEAPDKYAAKYLALFLMSRGIYFFFLGHAFCSCAPEICFSIPKTEAAEIEEFLAAIPAARPSSEEFLVPHLFDGADAGRLDLEQSRHAVAQVASQADTQYLADLWNAFAPGRKPETVDASLAPVPCQPVADVALTVLQPE